MTEPDGGPADPTDLPLLLQALADGELDAATSLALERRIAADPALAAEQARHAALREVFARLPRPPVTEAFQARIAALAEAPRPAAAPRPAPRFDWRAMAASVLVTAMLASGGTAWLDRRAAPDASAAAIASSHRRSLLAASPIDIASSDRHTVKPWLDAKVGLSPPAVDLAASGFALLGGRADVIGERVVPALVYRHHEHLITLVAEPRTPDMPLAEPVPEAAGGFALVHWTDPAFAYWAISDTERPQLDAFVREFRAATKGD
ncbi:anti-sigma factor family protein [Lichenifustis flavocetrariae]|uniref:Anti-sigma factor n=1 Tax=Lichenifustis flavocetrariae TaxID=2949735 RepID=A0AA42CI34_9HYPH|nr:anti-sigma factor [Lichenifustis flavocetrariae]MCW6508178.1 anti-sigma factor [Lichenifustis flavocetrariae]